MPELQHQSTFYSASWYGGSESFITQVFALNSKFARVLAPVAAIPGRSRKISAEKASDENDLISFHFCVSTLGASRRENLSRLKNKA